MKKILIAFALLALTAGCSLGESKPVTGTVVDKTSEPGEWEKKTVSGKKTCTGTGKKRRCRTGPSKTVDEWDDPDFELTIETDDGDLKTVEVSEGEYNATTVGDHYGKKN